MPQTPIVQGFERFTPLKVCPHCGTTQRDASRHCLECKRESAQERMRQVRALDRNTYLSLYYPQEFDRQGWAQAQPQLRGA
jgi:hypothetical protein